MNYHAFERNYAAIQWLCELISYFVAVKSARQWANLILKASRLGESEFPIKFKDRR